MTHAQPVFQPHPVSGMMLLVQDFSVYLPTGQRMTIKAGYRFNGCSIGREFWTLTGIYPYRPDVCRGALVHDGIFQAQPDGWTAAEATLFAAQLWTTDAVPAGDLGEIMAGLAIGQHHVWEQNSAREKLALARQFITFEPAGAGA